MNTERRFGSPPLTIGDRRLGVTKRAGVSPIGMQILAYMSANIGARLTLKAVARVNRISESTVQRHLRRHTGFGFHAVLCHLRVRHALALLHSPK